jgi:hypothetical protein
MDSALPEINNELKIGDFVLASFSEILEYRQSISYEGKYDPNLAQELDELIRTRYQEMADIGIILFEENPDISNEEILQELEEGFKIKLISKDGNMQPNNYGKIVTEYLEYRKLSLGHEKIATIDELPGITFNRESQKAYIRLHKSNQNSITNKITELLEDISQHGNPGKFVEEVASNAQKGYGWHIGKDGFKNCYLFDIGSAVRFVMDSKGVVRYIGDYHSDKTAEIRVSKQLKSKSS